MEREAIVVERELNIVECFSEVILNSDQNGVRYYSFLNLASMTMFLKDKKYDGMLYFVDGILLCFLLTILSGHKIRRCSFDFTSIADPIFSYAEDNKKSIYIVGAEQAQLDAFVRKIRNRYPRMTIAGSRDGYFEDGEIDIVVSNIKSSSANIVIAGLGAGKQENFLFSLSSNNYKGVAFTCGGFVRQESLSVDDYYPFWINKLSLRAFYRMYKEPHTIRRYLFDYPKNAIRLMFMVASKRIRINIF